MCDVYPRCCLHVYDQHANGLLKMKWGEANKESMHFEGVLYMYSLLVFLKLHSILHVVVVISLPNPINLDRGDVIGGSLLIRCRQRRKGVLRYLKEGCEEEEEGVVVEKAERLTGPK